MTYVLILTLIAGIGQNVSPAVAAVPGFETQDACERAAKHWYAEVREVIAPLKLYKMTAQCEPTR